MILSDDMMSKNSLVKEVAKRALWKEINGTKVVRLQHYFRDDESKKMDILFSEDSATSVDALDWITFQTKYEPVL